MVLLKDSVKSTIGDLAILAGAVFLVKKVSEFKLPDPLQPVNSFVSAWTQAGDRVALQTRIAAISIPQEFSWTMARVQAGLTGTQTPGWVPTQTEINRQMSLLPELRGPSLPPITLQSILGLK